LALIDSPKFVFQHFIETGFTKVCQNIDLACFCQWILTPTAQKLLDHLNQNFNKFPILTQQMNSNQPIVLHAKRS
jgi:hypothetical protein